MNIAPSFWKVKSNCEGICCYPLDIHFFIYLRIFVAVVLRDVPNICHPHLL